MSEDMPSNCGNGITDKNHNQVNSDLNLDAVMSPEELRVSYDGPPGSCQAADDGRAFSPLKIGFYELLIRQLLDDGFKEAADNVSSSTNILPNDNAPTDCLFKVYERMGFSICLASAASIDDDLLPNHNNHNNLSKTHTRAFRRPISDPATIQCLALEIAKTPDGPLANRSSQHIRWLPLHLTPNPPVADDEVAFDVDNVSLMTAALESSNASVTFNATDRWTAAHKASCTAVACTSDAKLCASGGDDCAVRVMSWRGNSSERPRIATRGEGSSGRVWTRVFTDHEAKITCMTFHPTLSVLFSGSCDGAVQVFNLDRHGLRRAVATIHDVNELCCMSAHPTGEFLLSGGTDPIIRLYDLNTLQTYTSLHPGHHHLGGVTDLACASGGSVFASSSCDGTIKIWDAVSNRVVNCINSAHNALPVQKVSWSRSNSYILSSGLDGTSKLWDVRTGKEILSFGVRPQHVLTFNVSRFLSDERYIVNVNSDPMGGDLSFYNSVSGKLISSLQTNQGRVVTFECVPRSVSVLAAASEFRCRLIDLDIVERVGGDIPRVPAVGGTVYDQEEMSIDL